MEHRRPACSEREARIMHLRFSRLRRSLQAGRLRSVGCPSSRLDQSFLEAIGGRTPSPNGRASARWQV